MISSFSSTDTRSCVICGTPGAMFATRPSMSNIRSTARRQPRSLRGPRRWNPAGPWQPKQERSITSRAGWGGYSVSKSTISAARPSAAAPP